MDAPGEPPTRLLDASPPVPVALPPAAEFGWPRDRTADDEVAAKTGGCPMSGYAARRRFPDDVPTLLDPMSGVNLRAHSEADLPAIVEQSRDSDSRYWTGVPAPMEGYSLADARDFALTVVPAGWSAGTRLGWAIEAEINGRRRFCGSIDLTLFNGGTAEVRYGLHPAARGRSIMSSSLRLVRDYGFDARGLTAIHWRARVGNWPARRVAAAAGFRFEGTVRRLLVHRGEVHDAWLASITDRDPRVPLPWMDAPVLPGRRVVLRPFADDDRSAVAEACSDPRTQHWLVSLPHPYGEQDAADYIEATREMAAQCRGLNWCVTDITGDRCVGSVGLDGFGGYSRRTEIGYWAHPSVRGRGFITEAVRLVTAYAESRQLTDSILIRCAAPNSASRHVAESAGYQQIGLLPKSEPMGDGSLTDLVLYSRP